EVHVVDALVEEQGEDVATELGVIHTAPEQVSGLLKKRVQLGLSQTTHRAGRHGRRPLTSACRLVVRFGGARLDHGFLRLAFSHLSYPREPCEVGRDGPQGPTWCPDLVEPTEYWPNWIIGNWMRFCGRWVAPRGASASFMNHGAFGQTCSVDG